MARRRLADWLKAYTDYTRHSEAPTIFHFWAGVSTIAGALRRRVWLDMRYFQWTPNFYIFFVAPPGIVSKSTTASIGMRLLRQVEGINFGPESITWQALAKGLGEAHELVEMPDGLQHPMCCLTIAASELGTFFNPQDREMVDVLVSLWDAQIGAWERATKTQGSDVIENPWLNIIGCTTPSWIQGNMPEYMIGGGFCSRSIFVYGEAKRQHVAYPGLVSPDAGFQQEMEDLVHDLRLIAELRGPFEITAEARDWGEAWYERHWKNPRPIHLSSTKFDGYLARKQTHIHKLAMVLAVSRGNDLVITKEILETAAILVTETERDMEKVFQKIGQSAESKHIIELVATVRTYKEISKKDLWRLVMLSFGTTQVFDNALSGAVNAGLVRLEQSSTKGTIVYPTEEK